MRHSCVFFEKQNKSIWVTLVNIGICVHLLNRLFFIDMINTS